MNTLKQVTSIMAKSSSVTFGIEKDGVWHPLSNAYSVDKVACAFAEAQRLCKGHSIVASVSTKVRVGEPYQYYEAFSGDFLMHQDHKFVKERFILS